MATQTAGPALEEGAAGTLTLSDRAALLRYMLLMRGIEQRAMTLYRQGKVPGSFYDGFGQEAVSVGAAFAMAPEDRLCTCTVTSARTSSAASRPLASSGSTWAATAASPAAATATCTSATGARAASGWSR